MANSGNKYSALLEEYVEGLDSGNENPSLILKLSEAAAISNYAAEFYKEALIHKHFYYKNKVEARKSQIISRLFSETEPSRKFGREYTNIWEYFSYLLKHENFSWAEILGRIGINKDFAKKFEQGSFSLGRVSPRHIRQIADLLGAEASKVVGLCYKTLVESKKAEPYYSSYRHMREELAPGFEEKHAETRGDERHREIVEYLRELQELFG